MRERRVLFYVQHLLGIGHLRRAATLSRALVRAGLQVTLVSGGHPVPGLDPGGARLVQLPPTRATDLYFKCLVDADEQPIDDSWKAARAAQLLALWREIDPHVLITELFPFGRRQMRFELLPLLDAATASPRRPVILSSVRDILVAQDKPGRNDEMLDLALRYFDRVLIHGDPELIGFASTFPKAERLSHRLLYTGYVVDEGAGLDAGADAAGRDEVLVSAGGGAVGDRLLFTALEARPLTSLNAHPWRVLAGANVGAETFAALRAAAGAGVVVERARPDFPSLLTRCRLSISQGGYNTMMEVIQAGAHAVAVPYGGGNETEQTLRARLLAEQGGIEVLSERDLSAANLAEAIERALRAPPAHAGRIDIGGAETSARLILGLAEALSW